MVLAAEWLLSPVQSSALAFVLLHTRRSHPGHFLKKLSLKRAVLFGVVICNNAVELQSVGGELKLTSAPSCSDTIAAQTPSLQSSPASQGNSGVRFLLTVEGY